MSVSSRSARRVAVVIVGFAILWLGYRYPLQINNAATSPVYRDTPRWLAMSKYVVMAALLCVLLLRERIGFTRTRLNTTGVRCVGIALGIAVWSTAAALGSGTWYVLEVAFAALFTPLACIVLGVPSAALVMSAIRRWAPWVWLLFFAVNALHWAAFAFFDRLPALAYRESVSVRFGSVWDDPNGYAFFLALAPFFALRLRLVWRTIFLLLFAANLVLTQSLTGIAAVSSATVAGLGIYVAAVPGAPARRRTATILAPLLAVALAFSFGPLNDLAREVLASKAGSISGHAGGLTALAAPDVSDWLGLQPPGWVGEIGYVNLLFNFGPPGLLILGVGLASACWVLCIGLTTAAGRAEAPERLSVLCFLLACAAGLANLPLEEVFPINWLFFSTIWVLVLADTRAWERPAPDTIGEVGVNPAGRVS